MIARCSLDNSLLMKSTQADIRMNPDYFGFANKESQTPKTCRSLHEVLAQFLHAVLHKIALYRVHTPLRRYKSDARHEFFTMSAVPPMGCFIHIVPFLQYVSFSSLNLHILCTM